MTIRAFIATAGSADLLDLLLASLEQYAPDVRATVIGNNSADIDVAVVCAQRHADYLRNPRAVGGAIDHASALDFAKTLPWDYRIAVTLDSDVLILSDAWRSVMLEALAEPAIGAWGVTWPDESPTLHPMCLAMPGEMFRRSPSFAPSDAGDTGAAVCRWIERHGRYLTGQPVEPDGWTPDDVGRWWKDSQDHPLLAHLGGGTHSDPDTMSRAARLRHWRAVRDRRRFIHAGERWLREHR